jgi:hypothetical protein
MLLIPNFLYMSKLGLTDMRFTLVLFVHHVQSANGNMDHEGGI